MKLSRNILAFTLLLIGQLALAQVRFTAKVNKNHVGKNEEFTLEFTVNAMARNFEAPDLSDFYVLRGPSRSQSTQIINFERSEQMSISYVLRPKTTGLLSIGAATIVVDGNEYRSQPLTIKISEESPRRDDPNDPYSIAAKLAFLKVLVSKTTVYQGEPLVASYKLFFNTQIGQFDFLAQPDFTGFYKSDVEIKTIKQEEEMHKGESFQTGIIKQMVLIPQRSGSIRPGLVELQIPTGVPTNRRDIFGRRMTQTVNQTSTDNFPGIIVKALPEKGKPSNFNGAVGNYKMDVSLSRDELTANESVTLTIKISGSGNIKLVEVEKPEIPAAFEAFDPKYSENISVNGGGMSGSKTYEYLLIPRYGGTYKIPEIKFSFFNPRTARYETLTSPEKEITVTGGKPMPGGSGGMASGEKEDVSFIGKDILFIKTKSGSFKKQGESFLNSAGFYAGLGTIGATFVGLIGFFLFTTNRKVDVSHSRSLKASKQARKHLSAAKKQMDENNTEAFYLELSSALWGYFSDKFSIPQSKLTKELIHDTLIEKGIDQSTADHVNDIMNRAELARFTASTGSTPNADYEETALLITKIDSQV